MGESIRFRQGIAMTWWRDNDDGFDRVNDRINPDERRLTDDEVQGHLDREDFKCYGPDGEYSEVQTIKSLYEDTRVIIRPRNLTPIKIIKIG